METKDFTLHRDGVDGDFDVTLYGTAGRPVIVFPEGNSSCASWGDGGMVDALAGLIDAGRVRLFCVDSADGASWYAGFAPTEYRLASLGGYFDLVENELVQLVSDEAPGAGAPLLPARESVPSTRPSPCCAGQIFTAGFSRSLAPTMPRGWWATP